MGDLSAEEISKFKGEDFLPEEKKREKEEIKKMKFKGPMKILAISNKGRMLREIQDIIDVNRNNYGLDTQLRTDGRNSSHMSEYYEKVKQMKEKYSNIAENDIKFLVE